MHNCVNCKIYFPSLLGTYAFVQYYDVVKDTEVPIDKVDKRLNCIRLKWARAHPEIEKAFDSGKEYALCPIESILGIVQLVRSHWIVSGLKDENIYKKSITQNLGPLHRWEGEMFYVNRFFSRFVQPFDVNKDSSA